MSGTLPPSIDADIKRFVDAVGAKIPLAGTKHYAEFRKKFKRQNYFQLDDELLVVKISRSHPPFWGLTKAIIDDIEILNGYCVVFLTSVASGWCFSKHEVKSFVEDETWPLAMDGNYKINSPLPEGNAFTSVQDFISRRAISN